VTYETPPPGDRDNSGRTGRFPSGRELIVIVKPEVGLRVTREGVRSTEGANVAPLARLLASEGPDISFHPLFVVSEEELKAEAEYLRTTTGAEVPDLSVYYRVEAPDERLGQLAARLLELDVVEAAYVKPPAEPAVYGADMVPREAAPPPSLPTLLLVRST
jgi:hypothetical protein